MEQNQIDKKLNLETNLVQNEYLNTFKDKTILILGALGFVGKNLLNFITQNNMFKTVLTADKQLPFLCQLPDKIKQKFKNQEYLHKQIDLSTEESVIEMFEEFKEKNINYVINLACETRFGFNNQHYEQKIVKLVQYCINQASKYESIEKFIEFSTYHVYKSGSKDAKENDKTNPVNKWSKFKLQSEEIIQKQKKINWVIFRPALIYGDFSDSGMIYRLMAAGIYKNLNEQYSVLWDDKLRTYTVNSIDVCRAIFHVLDKKECNNNIYNLVDNGQTNQGQINKYLGMLYGIKTESVGSIKSKFAWLKIDSLLKEINEKHLLGWHDLCQKQECFNTNLTIVLYKENLDNYNVGINGQKIQNTGFKYYYPILNFEVFLEFAHLMIQREQLPNNLDDKYKYQQNSNQI